MALDTEVVSNNGPLQTSTLNIEKCACRYTLNVFSGWKYLQSVNVLIGASFSLSLPTQLAARKARIETFVVIFGTVFSPFNKLDFQLGF